MDARIEQLERELAAVRAENLGLQGQIEALRERGWRNADRLDSARKRFRESDAEDVDLDECVRQVVAKVDEYMLMESYVDEFLSMPPEKVADDAVTDSDSHTKLNEKLWKFCLHSMSSDWFGPIIMLKLACNVKDLQAIEFWAKKIESQQNVHFVFATNARTASCAKLLDFIEDKTECLLYMMDGIERNVPFEDSGVSKVRMLCENGAVPAGVLRHMVDSVDPQGTRRVLDACAFSPADIRRLLADALKRGEVPENQREDHDRVVHMLARAAFPPSPSPPPPSPSTASFSSSVSDT